MRYVLCLFIVCLPFMAGSAEGCYGTLDPNYRSRDEQKRSEQDPNCKCMRWGRCIPCEPPSKPKE